MSQVKRNIRYEFILNEKENELFIQNFQISGLNSKAEFTRRLVTTYEVPCKLDFMKLNEVRNLAAGLGKNNGILKIYILEMSEKERTDFHINRIEQIIEENEELKKEIKSIIKNFKERGY